MTVVAVHPLHLRRGGHGPRAVLCFCVAAEGHTSVSIWLWFMSKNRPLLTRSRNLSTICCTVGSTKAIPVHVSAQTETRRAISTLASDTRFNGLLYLASAGSVVNVNAQGPQ